MAKTIPSKNIYSRQNDKIRDSINGVSAKIGTVKISNKEIGNFNLSIRQEETAKFLFLDYIEYKDNLSISTNESVSNIGVYTIGNVRHIGFRFNLSASGSFIDLDTVTANISFKVRYGVVKTNSPNYSLYSEKSYALSALSDIANKELTFNEAARKQIMVVETQGLVNPLYIIWANNSISGGRTRLKNVSLDVYVPYMCSITSAVDSNGDTIKNAYSGFSITDANISFYADVFDFDETTEKEYGAEPYHKIETNELFFETAKYNNENLFDALSNRIVTAYKNGKETAVIRCSVPEDLAVFEIGNEVIPMVYGADGADKPMSRYKNGEPKIFSVVGAKFIYDGAVWQELTLQEKTQSV